jgi:hypothetical protein
LRQHKQQLGIAELLAMPEAAAIDFEPPRLASNLFNSSLFEQLRLTDECADDELILLFGPNKDN